MTFNPSNLKNYGLFKQFWTTETTEDGLAHRGLDEVTPDGVENLASFAKTHEIDGSESAPDAQVIDDGERALMAHLLGHDLYGAFFEQDARPLIYEQFGIEQGTVAEVPPHKRPVSAGSIDIPSGVTNYANQLASADIKSLPKLMAAEYKKRKSFFEGSDVPAAERNLRALGLLKSYADALWARREQPTTEGVGHELLDVFETFKYATGAASKDYAGIGFSAAQALVLGLDPNNYSGKYPKAGPNAETTYLSMSDKMAKPMSYVDKWLAAQGKKTGAEKYELASPLGWMIGETSGHTKRGNLDEKKPFSTSGLNWGTLLFPGDAQIKGLKPLEGFEFPIDCIDALNNAVQAKPEWGDKIVVQDKDGAALNVEKVIHNDADGKPESWSAKFTNAAGEDVDPSTVLGVIKGSSGQIKGDGQASRSLNMWWWGFCDRNTAQRLYKSKYGIPQLDADVVRVKVGNEILEIPTAEAQKLLDADMPDIVTGETFTGFRFNDEAQHIRLKNGQTIKGRVEGLALEAGPGTSRIEGDLIAIHDAPNRPMLGTIEVKTDSGSEYVDVRNIDFIEKSEDGSVTVKTKEGWPKEVSGELVSTVPWDQAETVDGKQVLKQTDEHPIRGGFTIRTQSGKETRYDASEISLIAGETPKDLRISQYLTWVDGQKGMFATDSSTTTVVSNGMRWINKVELHEEKGSERPEWVGTQSLAGIEGPLKRQAGDKLVFVRGQYASSPDADPTSTAFSGWMQVSKQGRLLNEGFISGQPDFGWGADGELNWNAKSSFNPFMDAELRMAILVNGVSDQSVLEGMQDKLNLPANWKSLRVAPE